jgi:5-methylcytosine-specific restriction enzyme A
MSTPTHRWGAGDPRTSTTAWRRLKGAVIARDGNACRQCGADGRIIQLELDHIINVRRGGTDTLENTQLLCVDPCHKQKTQREAQAGAAAKRAKLKLPPEPHPGHRRTAP